MSYGEFLKRVLTVFGVGVAFLLFWQLRSIFMIAFLSSIIAISLSIPVVKLQQYGFRRGTSIAITLVSVVLGLALFITWILPTLVNQMTALMADLPAAFDDVLNDYYNWYVQQEGFIRDVLPGINPNNIGETLGLNQENSTDLVNPTDVASFILPVLANASNVILAAIANLLIVILVSIFLLLDPMDYARGFLMLIPPQHRKRALEVMVELRITVTAWMGALALSISVTIFLVWLLIGMILGVPNALALGVIAGLMTIVPNIGSVVPLIPLTIFTLADDPRKLPLVLGTYLVIQQLESNIITPYFVKRQLNIPTGVIFLFQIASASIFGVLGIVLAVPLLASIMTLVRELYLYDTLGMEDTTLEIEPTDDGGLKLVTKEMKPIYVKVRVVDSDHERDHGVYASPD